MLGLFFIRRKVDCTQRRRVLFTSEYYALYSGSLDWGRIFSRKIRHQFSLTYLTAFCLSCPSSRGYILFCEFSLPIICIRSVYYHSSRPVRKQLFHVITINVETGFAYTDRYKWRKSSTERFGRRPVYPSGTLSMAAGRSGYIKAFEYL